MSTDYLLPAAKIQQEVVVTDIQMAQRARSRLTALGITIGAVLRVFSSNGHGPLIVGVRGGRIAVGRGMAEGITVRRHCPE